MSRTWPLVDATNVAVPERAVDSTAPPGALTVTLLPLAFQLTVTLLPAQATSGVTVSRPCETVPQDQWHALRVKRTPAIIISRFMCVFLT